MRVFIFAFIILVALASSCKTRHVTDAELSEYILNPENGLIKERQSNGITLRVTYRPTDLLVKQHLEDISARENTVDSLRESLRRFTYFVIQVSRGDQAIMTSYLNDNNAIAYANFGIKNDVVFVSGKDTVEVFDHIYHQGFNLGNNSEFIVIFENNIHSSDDDCQLIFNDSFFGSGLNQFHFDTRDLKGIPSITSYH